MKRFIMVSVFALACCWGAYHFWPGSAGAAHVQHNGRDYGIPIMALVLLGGLAVGYKLSGK